MSILGTDQPNRSVTFQLEAADYVTANKLHVRKQYRKPLLLVFSICVTLAYLVFIVMSWHRAPPAPLAVIVHGAFWGGILWSLVSYFFLVPRQTRKAFQEQKGFQYPLTLTWSDDGIEVQNQQGRAAFPWTDLFRWAEDQRIILFYHSSRLFQMLPRRVLSDAQVDDLHRCIKTPKIK
ncbi:MULTISPECIES: YcxB family protein [unclassified Beijerinckia]|uniref:YcxB family protein n=1 Tax=unclassified Beijerinckia TaxID=2638183 RepID=UPI00089BC2FC|nr:MULTISPECIES: YcxB family protein [unclassified Beijerinckia]MDH7794659.1 hypothetical protein [Beijerinckia sp. GAS462]SEB70203.1 YcxB-like protein [Beijerinckia sp. 28-YEA-48]